MLDTAQPVKHPLCRHCRCPGVTIASFKGESEALSEIDTTKHALSTSLDDSVPIGGLH
jgi:hypothetical protein